jgi:hypothetical protein
MKVLLNKNNVVIAKAEDIKETEFGFYIKEMDTYYSLNDFNSVETNLNPRVVQDKLENGVIKPNPDYKTPEEIEELLKESK